MDEKLRETTNLGREVMNSKRQIKRKLGHVVQIRICVDVNVMLNLSINYAILAWRCFWTQWKEVLS